MLRSQEAVTALSSNTVIQKQQKANQVCSMVIKCFSSLAYLVATRKLTPVDATNSPFSKFVVIVEVVSGRMQLS